MTGLWTRTWKLQRGDSRREDHGDKSRKERTHDRSVGPQSDPWEPFSGVWRSETRRGLADCAAIRGNWVETMVPLRDRHARRGWSIAVVCATIDFLWGVAAGLHRGIGSRDLPCAPAPESSGAVCACVGCSNARVADASASSELS